MNVSQVRPEPLFRFKEVVGIGVVNGPYQQKNPKSTPYYMWTTSGRHKTYNVIMLLWPYLSLPKKEQITRCWNEIKDGRESKKAMKTPIQELPPI